MCFFGPCTHVRLCRLTAIHESLLPPTMELYRFPQLSFFLRCIIPPFPFSLLFPISSPYSVASYIFHTPAFPLLSSLFPVYFANDIPGWSLLLGFPFTSLPLTLILSPHMFPLLSSLHTSHLPSISTTTKNTIRINGSIPEQAVSFRFRRRVGG